MDAADGADVSDGIFERHAHPDDSPSSSAFTAEGNVDAERPKKSLRPAQVAGKSAGIFGPAGVVSYLAGAFNADPQKVSGGTGPGGALGRSKKQLRLPPSPPKDSSR